MIWLKVQFCTGMIQAGPFYGKLDLRASRFCVLSLQLLQEEVMDFEFKDLEIIEAEKSLSQKNEAIIENPATMQNSLILNELHKENEELQNKLKLNYRRLLLFESENNKLMEEKNKLFFEAQNFFQKSQMLVEKNEELEKLYLKADLDAKMMTEKVATYEKINRTQFQEIRRFSKFHTKIQDVVKPFIVNLKKQIQELKGELLMMNRINTNLTTTYKEFSRKYELELDQKSIELQTSHAEKNGLIRTYEEQIHSFSKEILDLQGKYEDSCKEVFRLKKAVEFKNYFENEVVRFKRTHEEDQNALNEMNQKKSAAEARILTLEQSLQEARQQASTAQNKLSDLEMNLEVTRSQFSKKIDELTIVHERLARLEKLNNQLSLEMSAKQN